MTATALRGRPSTSGQDAPRDASRTKLASSLAHLCPDEIAVYTAIREAGEYISPSRLHSIYLYVTTKTDADFDLGLVLTYLDPTGERATARALRAQTKEHTHA